jgi:hypothetical protein
MGKIDDTSAAETAEQIECQTGRRNPFTQAPDWVLLAPISRQAKLLYWALKAHVNTERGDNEVWPTQDMLAEIMELSDGRKIRPYLKELVAIDALKIRKANRYAGGMRTRSIYIVYETHPEGHDGPIGLKEFYKARKDRILAAQKEAKAQEPTQTQLDFEPQKGEAGAA